MAASCSRGERCTKPFAWPEGKFFFFRGGANERENSHTVSSSLCLNSRRQFLSVEAYVRTGEENTRRAIRREHIRVRRPSPVFPRGLCRFATLEMLTASGDRLRDRWVEVALPAFHYQSGRNQRTDVEAGWYLSKVTGVDVGGRNVLLRFYPSVENVQTDDGMATSIPFAHASAEVAPHRVRNLRILPPLPGDEEEANFPFDWEE